MQRVAKVLKDAEYKNYLAQNAVAEKDRKFCRHDLQHLLDVSRVAYLLVLEGNGPAPKMPGELQAGGKPVRELIYAAGLLHDIGRWKEYESGEDHAVVGAKLAGPILERAGFSAAEKEIIVIAIREHRAKGGDISPLGYYIARADDLSRPCLWCAARKECYKLERMETAQMLHY